MIVACNRCNRDMQPQRVNYFSEDAANVAAMREGWSVAFVKMPGAGAVRETVHVCPPCTEEFFGARLRSIVKEAAE